MMHVFVHTGSLEATKLPILPCSSAQQLDNIVTSKTMYSVVICRHSVPPFTMCSVIVLLLVGTAFAC